MSRKLSGVSLLLSPPAYNSIRMGLRNDVIKKDSCESDDVRRIGFFFMRYNLVGERIHFVWLHVGLCNRYVAIAIKIATPSCFISFLLVRISQTTRQLTMDVSNNWPEVMAS